MCFFFSLSTTACRSAECERLFPVQRVIPPWGGDRRHRAPPLWRCFMTPGAGTMSFCSGTKNHCKAKCSAQATQRCPAKAGLNQAASPSAGCVSG